MLFVFSFEDRNIQQSFKKYFLLTIEITDYKVVIDGRNFFDQPVNNDLRTYNNIRKIAFTQGNDYTIDYLIDYPYLIKIL